MKIYWGSGGIASAFLMSSLDGGEWSAYAQGIYCTAGWVGPSPGLDIMENNLLPLTGIEL
jgi:hypothetical protein